VVPQLDMLALLVEDGILAQRQCRLAIQHELHTVGLPSISSPSSRVSQTA
jgi:hypothetical protein